MNKSLIISIWILIFLVAVELYGGLNVTSPTANENVKAGSTKTIKWDVAGSDCQKVNIYLHKDCKKSSSTTITLSVANNGSYSWSVPSTTKAGKYSVRVFTNTCNNSPQEYGYSGCSNIVRPPNVPSTLNVSGVDCETIQISWSTSTNTTYYDIADCSGNAIATVSAPTTSYSHKNRNPNTTYSYKVKARNQWGDYGFTSCQSGKTKNKPYPSISGITCIGISLPSVISFTEAGLTPEISS